METASKTEPPKIVRREKRSSSSDREGDAAPPSRRSEILAQQQQQQQKQTGHRRLPCDVGKLDNADDVSTERQSFGNPVNGGTGSCEVSAIKEKLADVDTDTGPLKDYAYLYRKEQIASDLNGSDVIVKATKCDAAQSVGIVVLSPTNCASNDTVAAAATATEVITGGVSSSQHLQQVLASCPTLAAAAADASCTAARSPSSAVAGFGTTGSGSESTPSTSSTADDISLVSTSIVDYVRRSMSEAGVVLNEDTTGDAEYQYPPPLPVKASQTLQRGNRAKDDDEDFGTMINEDREMISGGTWEPTHMSWDEVLTEAQMLGIPLFRSQSRSARSDSERRSSMSSCSSVSQRSTPTSSPARQQTQHHISRQHSHQLQRQFSGGVATVDINIDNIRFRTVKRGSSTPSSIDGSGGGSNRRETSSKSRTGKFNLKNLLAKLANAGSGKLKDSTSPEHHHHHHHHHHVHHHLSATARRSRRSEDAQSSVSAETAPRSTTLTRRSMSQPDQHKARSLSASGGTGLRRAKINDSNISVGSAISQFYPTNVACRRLAAAAAAAAAGRSSSPGADVDVEEGQFMVMSKHGGVTVHGSLRSSAGSVVTDWSLPGSTSSNSLGSVFSQSTHSHVSSSAHSPWTPFSAGGGSDSGHVKGSSSPQCTLSTPVHNRTNRHVSPSRGPTRQRNTTNTMHQLNQCGWYWGAISWEESEARLKGEPDGSFLLRDSSDDRYLYSLSFCALGSVHHTRIEHYKGVFSFSAQSLRVSGGHSATTQAPAATSVVDFIQQAMVESHRCRDSPPIYTLQPRPPGLNPIPVRLLYPVSRQGTPASPPAGRAPSATTGDDCVKATTTTATAAATTVDHRHTLTVNVEVH